MLFSLRELRVWRDNLMEMASGIEIKQVDIDWNTRFIKHGSEVELGTDRRSKFLMILIDILKDRRWNEQFGLLCLLKSLRFLFPCYSPPVEYKCKITGLSSNNNISFHSNPSRRLCVSFMYCFYVSITRY